MLRDCVSDDPWIRRSHPFPHVLVPRLFEPGTAAEIDAEVSSIVRSPAGMRHFGWYDAFACGFAAAVADSALAVFVSRAFHDLVADRMGVPALGYVNGGVHHHREGSRSGFIHNDLNPVYFDTQLHGNEIVLPMQAGASYTHGTGAWPGAVVHQVVRCTTIIYYTANRPWRLGDGGETALYARADADLSAPAARIPPVNNSVLIFNCSGSSHHAFLRNNRIERNSIVVWLHASVEYMAAAHGEHAFVRFAR